MCSPSAPWSPLAKKDFNYEEDKFFGGHDRISNVEMFAFTLWTLQFYLKGDSVHDGKMIEILNKDIYDYDKCMQKYLKFLPIILI